MQKEDHVKFETMNRQVNKLSMCNIITQYHLSDSRTLQDICDVTILDYLIAH